MKKLMVALVVGVTVFGASGSALAETGKQRFVINYSGPISEAFAGARHVVASGPISGVGTETAVTQGPGPSPGTFVGTSVFSFPDGTVSITVNGTIVDAKQFGPNDCFSSVTISGTFDITGGTGEFAGADGAGTFEGKNRVFPAPGPEGCSSEDVRLVSTIRNTGTATVP